MDNETVKPSSIDEYINQYSPEVQEILMTIRKVIQEAAPDANEKISYQMPAFELNGILVYFAAQKKHLGFYPTASGIEAFKEELSNYKGAKGSVQFPYDKPIPYELIRSIVKYRVNENLNKPRKKSMNSLKQKSGNNSKQKSENSSNQKTADR